MHAVDLIALKDGHWAAHCEQLQTGSVAENRAAAIAAIQEIIQNPEPASRHPKNAGSEKRVYTLGKPGHHAFPTPGIPPDAD